MSPEPCPTATRSGTAPSRLAAFARDRDGIAAIEFALIVPVMLTILFGLIEFPRAYGTSEALARSARTMADLISRGSQSNVSDVYAAGSAVTYPYDSSAAKIILTAVGVYKKGNAFEARVCSSVAKNTTARAVKSVIGVPVPSEATEGARYVMAEITFTFAPVLNFFPGLNGLTFSKSVAWPTRGTGANSYAEVVLPGGNACPAS